jgi:hypothetical protein
VESESEGILGAVGVGVVESEGILGGVGVGRNFRWSRSRGVGVGRNFRWSRSRGVGVGMNFFVESESVKMYRLRLLPQSKILTRYANSKALIATVTIRLTLKCRL